MIPCRRLRLDLTAPLFTGSLDKDHTRKGYRGASLTL